MPDPSKQEPFPRPLESPTTTGIEAPRVIEGATEASSIEFNPSPEMPLPEPSPVVQGYVQTRAQQRPLTQDEKKVGITDSHYFSSISSLDQVTLGQTEQNMRSFGNQLSVLDLLKTAFSEHTSRIVGAGVVFWQTLTRQKERQGSHA